MYRDPTRLKRLARSLLASALLLCVSANAGAALDITWQDDFSAEEQRKLVRWVEETHAAVEQLVGPYPFDVHIFFHRRDGAREPVPWANTERGRVQGVHFHVDPRFSLGALRSDWTAAHELSHLALPYLGRRHAWFAEGFASYMQYQVMAAMGVISPAEAARRYAGKLARAERRYRYPDRPFAAAAPRLRAEGNYPTMYWGGAVYFMQVDEALRAHSGQDFIAVLREYVACCRRNGGDIGVLLGTLDELADSTLFSRHYRNFQVDKGFPRYGELELSPPPRG